MLTIEVPFYSYKLQIAVTPRSSRGNSTRSCLVLGSLSNQDATLGSTGSRALTPNPIEDACMNL